MDIQEKKRFAIDTRGILSQKKMPDIYFELEAKKENLWPVAGVDEVGRGPLAGPVVVAAVILDIENVPEGIDDSKRLTHKKRSILFDRIMESALSVSVVSLPSVLIDQQNILQVSLEAMRRAIFALSIPPAFVFIDGRETPLGLDCLSQSFIKGDQISASIAAASIVAKVIRDHMMSCCTTWNDYYGFDHNAGYGTKRHQQGIAEHGTILGMHRMSFAGVGT